MYYRVYRRDGRYIRDVEKEEVDTLEPYEYIKGVVCIALQYNAGGGIDILLERRTPDMVGGGLLNLFSGHVDGGESNSEAMKRELSEELLKGYVIPANISLPSTMLCAHEFAQRKTERNWLIEVYVWLVPPNAPIREQGVECMSLAEFAMFIRNKPEEFIFSECAEIMNLIAKLNMLFALFPNERHI